MLSGSGNQRAADRAVLSLQRAAQLDQLVLPQDSPLDPHAREPAELMRELLADHSVEIDVLEHAREAAVSASGRIDDAQRAAKAAARPEPRGGGQPMAE